MLKILLLPIVIVGLVSNCCASIGEIDPASGQLDRDSLPDAYKWNLELFYPSWSEWETDLVRIEQVFEEIVSYQGRLSEGPDILLKTMLLTDEGSQLLYKAYGYASKWRDLDTRDNAAQAKIGKVIQLWSRVAEMASWIDPEILTIPKDTMSQWIDENSALEPYRFNLMDTYRTSEFTLDSQGERLLSLHGAVRGTASNIYDALTDADGDRPVVTLSSGEETVVTYGTYSDVLNSNPNPEDRNVIQEAWMEQFEKRRNTFAAIYNGVVQQNWALAQSRGYQTSLGMRLNRNNIPEEIVTSLIKSARKGASELQRYHQIRQKFLGLADYGWSDAHVPLILNDREYAYEEIVPWIVESVAPLGNEYQSKMAEQFTAGYVDVFETPGKTSGAYNSGTYGIGSFVLLNYQSGLDDVFTVAHEMGHSMHTRLAQEYQPFSTHDYTIFVAEVASTLNEKLLLQKLLKEVDNTKERIAFIEQQLEQISGTYFLQTMMADYEIQAHGLMESGQGLTADMLTDLWKGIVQAYFGDVIPEDDPYMTSWARIPHLYNSPFYVYQYATCYAASAAFMNQMREDPQAVDRYLNLLKSGGNDFPMAQLQKAGIDLSDDNVLNAVTEEFGRLVDLLEQEYSRYLSESRQG